jgi:hypothetical protein
MIDAACRSISALHSAHHEAPSSSIAYGLLQRPASRAVASGLPAERSAEHPAAILTGGRRNGTFPN